MRGVFWIIEDELKAYIFEENAQYGVAKSGNNFNHKLLWDHIKPAKCRFPYDYYPRGRVEYNGKGKPIVYMNPNIDKKYIPQIMDAFELTDEPKVDYDGSKHYKCYLDRQIR